MKLRWSDSLCCAGALALLAACGGDPAFTGQGAPDADDASAMDAGTDAPDACVPTKSAADCPAEFCGAFEIGCGLTVMCGAPVEACPPDACGTIADGCGGTLECEPCPCDGDIPLIERCGRCDFGTLECDDGVGTCLEPVSIPGIHDADDLSACDAAALYVDAAHTGPEFGNREQPFTTIAKALEVASDQTRAIVMREGSYESETIAVPVNVSLVGGLLGAGEEWITSEDARSVIRASPGGEVGHAVGIEMRASPLPVLLSGIDLRVPDAPAETHNYGVVLSELADAAVRGVSINVGKGGDGADGVRGADGTTLALDAQCIYNPPPFIVEDGSDEYGTCHVGGLGGGTWSSGGEFGLIMFRGQRGGPRATEAFPNPSPPLGGEGGREWISETMPELSGQDGIGGAVGMKGAGAAPGATLEGARFATGTGRQGAPGSQGTGGGGGGRAKPGSTCVLTRTLGSPFGCSGSVTTPLMGSDAAGGRGGHGGPPGAGGLGGQSGGHSTGLLIEGVARLALDQLSVTTNVGGAGGEGGLGGVGAPGTSGDDGKVLYMETYVLDIVAGTICTYNGLCGGASGGDGGRGGDGGQGGDGAGGASVGIVCDGVQNATATDLTFELGQGGPGGDPNDASLAGLSLETSGECGF